MAPVTSANAPKVPANLDIYGNNGQGFIDNSLKLAQQGDIQNTKTANSGTAQSSGTTSEAQKKANAKAAGQAAFDAFLTPDLSKTSVFLNPDYEVTANPEGDNQYAKRIAQTAKTLQGIMNSSVGIPGSSSAEAAPSGINAASLQLNNGGIAV